MAPARLALLVGIDYVKDRRNRLYGCVNDMWEYFRLSVRDFGFDPADIVLLTDVTTIPKDITKRERSRLNIATISRSRLLTEIDETIRLANASPDGAQIFFTYAGHGAQTRDDDHGEEADGLDEYLYLPNGGMVRDDTLYDHLLKAAAASVEIMAILDCCHSASGMDMYCEYDGKNKVFHQEHDHDLLCTAMMISGCMDTQTSAEHWKQANGAATLAITRTLREALRRRPGQRPAIGAFLKAVYARLDAEGFVQRPRLSASFDVHPDGEVLWPLGGTAPTAPPTASSGSSAAARPSAGNQADDDDADDQRNNSICPTGSRKKAATDSVQRQVRQRRAKRAAAARSARYRGSNNDENDDNDDAESACDDCETDAAIAQRRVTQVACLVLSMALFFYGCGGG